MKPAIKVYKGITTDKIYDYISNDLITLHKKYEYLCSSDEEFEKLIKSFLDKINNNINNISDMKGIVLETLDSLLNKYAKNHQDKILYNCICTYFNSITGNLSDVGEAEKHFLKLIQYFKSNKNLLTPKIVKELLNDNQNIFNTVKTIVDVNMDKIISGEYYSKHDDIDLTFIEMYCDINNIDTDDLENMTLDDNSIEDYDSVKIYFNQIKMYRLLTPEEEKCYFYQMKNGDKKARKILLNHNLRLVVSVAKSYRTCNMMDIISAGNEGLIKAVDKFDVTKGYKFSTYSRWWIRQSINKYLSNETRNIRIPVYIEEDIKKYRKLHDKFISENDREPSIEEMATIMGKTVNHIERLKKLQTETVSLNKQVSDEIEEELGDVIADSDASVEEQVENRLMFSTIKETLKILPDIERRVLELRYGLIDRERTLKEVAEILNISGERVRQIESKAFRTLRTSGVLKNLSGAVNGSHDVIDSKCKSERKKNTKQQTIYEKFSIYTFDQVNRMLTKLTSTQRALITLKYGNDLLKPVQSPEWSLAYSEEFEKELCPIMYEYLKQISELDAARKKLRQKQTDRVKQNDDSNLLDLLTKLMSNEQYNFAEDELNILSRVLSDNRFKHIIEGLSNEELYVLYYRLGCMGRSNMSLEVIAVKTEIHCNKVREILNNVISEFILVIENNYEKTKMLKK